MADSQKSKKDSELSPELYHIAREKGTEAPFSGKYVNHHEKGMYRCAVCGTELFSSDTKFDSGTGWPSFTQPVNRKHILLKEDTSHLPAPRFSVYVIRCDDGSFYIGQTDNIVRRWEEHKNGKIKWTNKHKPIEVIHHEKFITRDEAVHREKYLKTSFGRKWLKQKHSKGELERWNEGATRQAGGMTRTEVVCKTCGAHLGHVFFDLPAQAGGPKEKGGQRYCINSTCLAFQKEN